MAITVTYLAHNVVGSSREDYIKVVTGAADTSGTVTTRIPNLEVVEVMQDGASPDILITVVPAQNIFIFASATASHTYRFRATGR